MIPVLMMVSCEKEKPLVTDNETLSFEERSKALIAQMTLEEKVSQLSYTSPAIERLGIPAYNWWNECLHGVARAGKATVFPQAIGLGAMFDREQMSKVATAISDEARAKHQDFVSKGKRGIYQGLTFWTPNINIFRDPRWGRGMETYGEDPYLTGELGVRFIKGLQGDDPKYLKLVATAKHFVVHSGPESERHKFDAVPSAYDFLYTYTPHFEKAVKEADVYSVMCAYNSYKGTPCCGNLELSSLLRDQWGFKGYIVSDCWAIKDFYDENAHAVVPTKEEAAAMAVKAGTDLNCGDTYPSLVNAVKLGHITEKELDVSLERLLVARFKLGLFAPQGANKYENIPYSVVDSEIHRLLALETARKSMVLLKNENNTLPLSKSLKKIAVIGSNANDLEVLLGNYNGFPSNPVTPLTGLRQKLPDAQISYAPGCRLAEGLPIFEAIPGSVLFTDANLKTNGLNAAYFNNLELSGEPMHKRVDANIDFIWETTAPFKDLNADAYSVRWTGFLKVPESGKYALGGEAFSGMRLFIDGKKIIERFDVHHPKKEYEYIDLVAGKAYEIKIEYRQENTDYAIMRLLWEKPQKDLMNEAIKIAKEAEVIVLCMGISPLLEGEEMKVRVDGFSGGDRLNTNLPATQTALMKELKKLGKPMVLVLLNGSALSVNWEHENIPAIVEAWYPGQAGGTALADILFGDYNPSGRLPLTFYKDISDIPTFNDYNMKGKTYKYFKGTPLYEFGYGLSYTDFEYANLLMPAEIKTGDEISISVDVKNKGERDGEEVVQVYLNREGSMEHAPLKSLIGFERVFIKKGETKKVQFKILAKELFTVNSSFQKVIQPENLMISVGGAQYSKTRQDQKKVVSKQLVMKGTSVVL
ncbi:MAG: glycoside hydrolase family 3 C-terminal domain-containing protein [Flavobacteriaceae bacterium]|nr:glycoside hydrolase family 3 C-terminal domain-containing protein [Flavobacteriaceae bacterium]